MTYWNRNAERFNKIYDSKSWANKVFRKGMYLREQRALEYVRLLGAPMVLDIGCGSGRQIAGALQSGAERVVGVDSSPAMLILARKIVESAHVNSCVELIEADYRNLCLSERFDIVWALGVFDYAANPDELLNVMKRHSNCLMLATFRRIWTIRYPFRNLYFKFNKLNVHFYSKDQIFKLYRQHNCEIIKIENIGSLYFVVAKATDCISNKC